MNVNDGYLGSGTVLRKAVKKHGREKFIKEVLFVFGTKEAADLKEIELVYEERDNPKCYNIAKGGEAGWDYVNEAGVVSRHWRDNRESRREAIRRAVQKKWNEPEHHATHAAANGSPNAKAKQSLSHIKQWENLTPEKLKEIKANRSEMWKDPKRKQAQANKVAKSWTPERLDAQKQIAIRVNHTRWHQAKGIVDVGCELCH